MIAFQEAEKLLAGMSLAEKAERLRSCPTLRAADLTNAWAYARSHAEEIDQQIRENEAAWHGMA